jgi:hypothetical protein
MKGQANPFSVVWPAVTEVGSYDALKTNYPYHAIPFVFQSAGQNEYHIVSIAEYSSAAPRFHGMLVSADYAPLSSTFPSLNTPGNCIDTFVAVFSITCTGLKSNAYASNPPRVS